MTKKEVIEIVRAEIKKAMRDENKKASDKFMTEKEVKEMIRKTMHNYQKWMWEKKGMWMNQI